VAKVAIFTEDLYEDVEFWYPFYRLKEAGHQTVVIGSGKKDTFNGKHGIPNRVDQSIRTADPGEFDALLIPGGYAPDRMRLHHEFAEFTRKIHDSGKVVASLCHGPWILVSAGIVKGRKMTSWPTLKDDIINAGGRYKDEEVVVDGNIITSRGPDDLPAFMREVIKALGEEGKQRRKEALVTPQI